MINDPLYNHTVFGPNKGKGGIVGKTDAQLIQDLIAIHNAENWLGMDGDSELSMFNKADKDKEDLEESSNEQASKTPSPTSLDSSNASRDSNTPSGNLVCTQHRTPLLFFFAFVQHTGSMNFIFARFYFFVFSYQTINRISIVGIVRKY